MAPVTNAPIGRDRATKGIADHIADRDAYVVTVPPYALLSLARSLTDLPAWNAYLDIGTPLIMWTDKAEVLLLTGTLLETATVVVVPKTVPPATLSRVVGQGVAEDGSQDLVILRPRGGPTPWPTLFVDALEIVDPRAATELRAHDIPNLN